MAPFHPMMLTLPSQPRTLTSIENIQPISSQSTNIPSFFPFSQTAPPTRYSQSEFLNKLKNHDMELIELSRQKNDVTFLEKNGDMGVANVIVSSDVLESINHSEAEVVVLRDNNNFGWIWNTVPILLPIILFYVIFRKTPFGGNPNGLPNNRKDVITEAPEVSFDDIAGIDEAKMEIMEVVDFLKNPEKYEKLRAKVPTGCLLIGPPGVGKTMLAKAIANEAEVPFFACSGSEFVEIFIGMGASKVRELFDKARKASPCIIYIDEIDAVGRKRSSSGAMGGNDERDQTLNQLLVEMDGVVENDKIIVIASTNREDILDSALIRPGRFDRKIHMKLPNQNERLKIFNIHMDDRPVDESLDLKLISQMTTSFSGADIANLINESAIIAARDNSQVLNQNHFNAAFDRILFGTRREISSERARWITAVHEIGHVLSAIYLTMSYDKLFKVTIESRGDAGGMTMFLPNEDNQTYITKTYLLEKIVVLMGGRAAELVVFGEHNITTGASHDLEMATAVCQNMITKFGFSDMGKVSWDTNTLSDEYLNTMNNTVKDTVMKKFHIAHELMKQKKGLLLHLSTLLLNKQTMTEQEILDAIIHYHDTKALA